MEDSGSVIFFFALVPFEIFEAIHCPGMGPWYLDKNSVPVTLPNDQKNTTPESEGIAPLGSVSFTENQRGPNGWRVCV
jgi:hypothetical protein